jgi:hypothetical protein
MLQWAAVAAAPQRANDGDEGLGGEGGSGRAMVAVSAEAQPPAGQVGTAQARAQLRGAFRCVSGRFGAFLLLLLRGPTKGVGRGAGRWCGSSRRSESSPRVAQECLTLTRRVRDDSCAGTHARVWQA